MTTGSKLFSLALFDYLRIIYVSKLY